MSSVLSSRWVGYSFGLFPSLQEVITNADCIRHGGKRWIHRPDTDEEARIDDVQVVEFMRLAIGVEHGTFWIGAKAAGSCLMRAARDGDFILHVNVAWYQVMRVHAQVIEHGVQFVIKL